MSRGVCRLFPHCLETPLGLKINEHHNGQSNGLFHLIRIHPLWMTVNECPGGYFEACPGG